MAEDSVNVKVDADTSGVESGLRSAASSIESAFGSMKSQAESLTGVFSALQVGFMGLAAALGAEVFSSAIEAFERMAEQAERTSEFLGITTEEASVLGVALKEVGSSNETYNMAVMRLDRQLKSHEDQMRQVMKVGKDVNLMQMSQTELMNTALSALMQYREGTERNSASLYLFGRNIGSIQPLMEMMVLGMDHARDVARSLGIEMSENDVLAAKNFKLQMADLSTAFDAVKVKMGQELLPILVQLVTWLNQNGPEAIRRFSAALDGLNIAFISLKVGAQVIVIMFNELVRIVSAAIGGIVTGLQKLATGKFGDAKAAVQGMMQEMKSAMQEGFEAMTKVAVDGREKIDKIIAGEKSGLPTGGMKGVPKGNLPFTPPVTGATSQMGDFKAQLQVIHDAQATNLQKMTQNDIEFWGNILKNAKLSVADYMAVFHELSAAQHAAAEEKYQDEKASLDLQLTDARKNYTERMALLRQEASLAMSKFGERSSQYAAALRAVEAEEVKHKEELRKIQDEELTQAQEHQSRLLGAERSRIDFESSMGMISSQERIARESSVEERDYQLKLAALNQRKALYREDEAEQRKIAAQISALQDEHALQVQESQQKMTLALKTDWEDALGALTRTFDTTVQGWLQGTQTFQQGMNKLFMGILSDFVSMTLQMMVKWAAMELANSNVSSLQSMFRRLLGIEEAATAGVTKGAQAAGDIAASAAQAGAGAIAATAAIPIVGPELAPAAGAAAYSQAISFLGAVPAFKTGTWNLPSDTLAYLHRGESVLTADQTAGASGGMNIAVSVTAMDSRDVARALKEGGVLHKTLKELQRNFVR